MLESVISSGNDRPITWIHGSRSYEVHAFRDKVNEFSSGHGSLFVHTFYDRIDRKITGNYYQGYVDLSQVKNAIIPGADFYICGPGVFMKRHVEYLRSQGVNPSSIHFEEFGPAVLVID